DDLATKERQTATSLAYHEWRDNRPARARDVLKDCPEGPRCWGWDYLDRLCRGGALRLTPPGGFDCGGALSPARGRRARPRGSLARGQAAGATETVHALTVWDLPSGRRVCSIPGLKSRPWSLAFRPGGQLAASADDRTIQVWDLGKRQAVFSLKGAG